MTGLPYHISNENIRGVVPGQKDFIGVRQEIKNQLFASVDPEVVSEIPGRELIEQVTFVVEELLRRDSIELHNGEMAVFAGALADDLVSACSGKYSLRQKLI